MRRVCGCDTIGDQAARWAAASGLLLSVPEAERVVTLPSTDILERVISQATEILRKRCGPDLTLVHPQIVKDATRMIVARAGVRATTLPCASVIVKVIRDDPATGFTEWASLAFLADRPAARRLVPGWLGGDIDQRLFVIADLGPGDTLQDVLRTSTRAAAERVLHGMAQQMARLHVATVAAEDDFLRVRQALPAVHTSGRRHEATAWLAASDRLVAWLTAVGCGVPSGFDECLAQIAAAYAEPTGWLGFTHGDPAPSNAYVTGDAVWLLDFEYGAFRHVLYDITAWNILCPLPLRQVQLLRRAFQAELGAAFPLAQAAESFDHAWALLCAYRGLALLTWVAPTVLAADRPFVGDWSARQAVLAAVTRTAAATAAVASLSPLTTAIDALQAALRARWREFDGVGDVATRWPALEDAG